MSKLLEKPIVVIVLLLVLSSYLYFFQLDKIALTDPDETFYAQTAKEMVLKNEWLTPTLYGKPQFEKPILFYWLIEISYKIFGINEFAVRFPCALFGFLGLVGVYLLGRLLFNYRTGIFSAVILATCLEYIILSVGCVTDMVLTTLLLFGVFFFFCGQIKKKDYFYLISSAFFAFATLTKGPIGLLLPGFIIIIYLLLTRDFSLFKRWALIISAMIVFGIIAKPWYLIMYKLYPKDFIEVFFGFHNITRFIVPEHKIGSGVFYNIPIVLGGFFPWSAFLPLGLWHFIKTINDKRKAVGERNYSLFVMLWLAVIFIFFTISSTKLPTYIFPCFISLALITGKLWDDFSKRGADSSLVKWGRISYFAMIAVILIALPVIYLFLRARYPSIAGSSVLTGLFLLLGVILSFTAIVNKKYVAALFLIAYSVAVMIYPINNMILPGIEEKETSEAMSKELLKYYKEGERIACEKDYCAGVAFYTGKIPISVDNYSVLVKLMNSKDRVWIIMKQRNISDLVDAKEVINKPVILYKSGKKRLLTNKPL